MSNEILINLGQDSYARSFSENSIIHQNEFKRVKEIIKSLKEKNRKYQNGCEPTQKDFSRFYNTITISGSRGTGKTSFILSLLNDGEVSEDVETLPMIDPTLIEDKGHIFLNIIQRIKERVDIKMSKRDSCTEDCDYKCWLDSLKDLAEGLPMLDGIADGVNGSDWNDATYVMFKGLSKVHGANNLEYNFHKYVKLSLRILKKEEFIIAFDDIDTDFTKGWPVLELLRKYFTTPQIISIISGDMSLYTLLVRKKQWNNFGKALLKNEYDNKDEYSLKRYNDLVYQLANQYLLKVLKTDKRVQLESIRNLISISNNRYFVVDNDENHIGLLTFYETVILSKWHVSSSNYDVFLDFLLDLPIRTQISLLKYYADNADTTFEGMASNITDVFYAELQKMGVDVWGIFNDHSNVNVAILKMLVENGILDEGSQLLPKLEDPIKNAALTAMGVVFLLSVEKNKSSIFDYMIRVSNVVDKIGRFKSSEFSQIHTGFINESQTLSNSGDKKIASLQSAYLVVNGSRFINDGLIPLYGLSEKSHKRAEHDRIDEVFNINNSMDVKDYLAIAPLISFQDNNGNSSLCYSFYNIIGTIADILSLYEHHPYSSTPTKSQKINQLNSLMQFRTYRINKEGVINDEERDASIDKSIVNEQNRPNNPDNPLIKLEESISDWMSNEHNLSIPPYLIGRIMSRTNYAISSIQLSDYSYLNEILNRQLICFLNAVLVEEAMDKGLYNVNLSNPVGSDAVFVNNREALSSYVEGFSFFNFLITCPLVSCYINPNLELPKGRPFSIYDELSIVRILNNPKSLLSDLKKRTPRSVVAGRIIDLDGILDDINSKFYSNDARNSYAIFAKYCMNNHISKQEIIYSKDLRENILKKVYLGFSKAKYSDSRFIRTIQATNYILNNTSWI